MKTDTGIWRCDCATNNSELRMRCRYCHALRPIPVGVFYNAEAANFYDVGAQGMGEDFYVFWRGRAAEFPSATPDVKSDGFNAFGSGPVPIEAREPVESDVLDMRGIGNGATMIDSLASIDIDQIALECARKVMKLTAIDPTQMVAKIQVEVRAAIARRQSSAPSVDASGVIHWTPKLEAARIALCGYWIDVADQLRSGKIVSSDTVHAKAIETEQALTVLGDIANRRSPPPDLDDDMVVRAMEHVPGCDHDDMVSALEAALCLPSSKTG